ncbi:hypothetical protein RRG08_030393 [Elysia crispata]|uniref:Uncharacterized protein n=1 Tax=Elysia crispata TaxID=231223 RepID=A0AAE0YG67_9GAST|nr:hypothetical protein RRG08_030393 [Elysia crispata]
MCSSSWFFNLKHSAASIRVRLYSPPCLSQSGWYSVGLGLWMCNIAQTAALNGSLSKSHSESVKKEKETLRDRRTSKILIPGALAIALVVRLCDGMHSTHIEDLTRAVPIDYLYQGIEGIV